MDWTLTDGSIPSTRCERCQRATPILVKGLGFDCCADDVLPAENMQADPPLVGATVPFWVYPVVAFIAFAVVCVGSAS